MKRERNAREGRGWTVEALKSQGGMKRRSDATLQ